MPQCAKSCGGSAHADSLGRAEEERETKRVESEAPSKAETAARLAPKPGRTRRSPTKEGETLLPARQRQGSISVGSKMAVSIEGRP